MNWMTVLPVGAAILGVALGATMLLPRVVEVERRAVLDMPPEVVLALAASTDGYQTFNPYLSADPNLSIAPFGPASGVGAGFAFDGKDGTGTQTVAEVTSEHVAFAIDLGALGQPTQVIRAVPHGTGSEVTWRMTSDLGINPAFRIFGLFLERIVGPTFETGLDNLTRANA